MKALFYILLFAFVAASAVFLILGIYEIDTLLIVISILFAVCALLIGLENKQNMQNPFNN